MVGTLKEYAIMLSIQVIVKKVMYSEDCVGRQRPKIRTMVH